MQEVVLEYLESNFFMLFYAVALFLSIKKYHLYFNSILKFLPILIAYTFLSELLGYFIMHFESIQVVSIKEHSFANNLVFNIYDLIYLNYFYFVFWKTFRVKWHKNVVGTSVIVGFPLLGHL